MEWHDARWVGFYVAALLWAGLITIAACALPGGSGGGSLVQQHINVSERLVHPPAASGEQVHIYSGAEQSAKVFWEQPRAGKVHLTIELPGTTPQESNAPSTALSSEDASEED